MTKFPERREGLRADQSEHHPRSTKIGTSFPQAISTSVNERPKPPIRLLIVVRKFSRNQFLGLRSRRRRNLFILSCSLVSTAKDQRGNSYLPVLGGEDHCRSICSTARVHSDTQAWLSFSMPDGDGLRPPHMTGLAACRRACFWINPLV